MPKVDADAKIKLEKKLQLESVEEELEQKSANTVEEEESEEENGDDKKKKKKEKIGFRDRKVNHEN
jgi:hypothetical protein